MLLKKTNIEERLARARANSARSEKLLLEVREILNAVSDTEIRIEKKIKGGRNIEFNAFDFDLLETDKIFHIDRIRQVCIDYRLRFLDSRYFKADIPQEAIHEIKQLEKSHGIEINGFKIVAPSKLFKLKDKDDPLLFAPIGNGYFYLIHKWGEDLHPLRKILMWPFKSVVNLIFMVFLMSYLISLMVPEGLFSKSSSSAEFWIVCFFMFKSIAAVVLFYGIALGKNFNPAIWNRKYFNA